MTEPTHERKPPLAELIQSTLRSRGKRQKELAITLRIEEPELSAMLSGRRNAPKDRLHQLAETLQLPTIVVLLAAQITECQREEEAARRDGKPSAEKIAAARKALEETYRALREQMIPKAPRAYTSLEDFPFGNEAWTVLAGDRREKVPSGLGDLVAMSVSASDFMFMPQLGLPKESLVISDKVVRLRDDPADLARIKLLRRNLLVLGSPAVSIATRHLLRWKGAPFMFNTSNGAYDEEQSILARVDPDARYDAKELDRVQREETPRINNLLATLRKPGFVDPVRYVGIRGRHTPLRLDYGIVTLTRNPWSPSHVACICAGIHGPGTAGAVQMLATRSNFAEHPWGGVLKVSLPEQAPWEERFLRLSPEWSTHSYSPDAYIADLDGMIAGLSGNRNGFGDVEIGMDTLKSVRETVDYFRSPRAPGSS
jgi:transcriptional regulator with XRE-family HTH domain